VKQQNLREHDVIVDDIKYRTNEQGDPSLSGVATTGENGFSQERVKRDFSPEQPEPSSNTNLSEKQEPQKFEERNRRVQARNFGYQSRGGGDRGFYQNHRGAYRGTGPFMNPTSFRRHP